MSEKKGFQILNKIVKPGKTKTINLKIAQLHTMTELKIPIIVSHSENPGPVVLFCAGLHGDEFSGIEIVRQIIKQKLNKPKMGTIICIPLVNVFGFVNQSREFPDGRDLNRVFPGSSDGSLASQFAYHLMTFIVPLVDYVIDFHSGGRSRFNAPQIRIENGNEELLKLATAFHAPFLLFSKNIEGSFRESCDKLGKSYLLFEGGKSYEINKSIVQEAVNGVKRFLNHLGILSDEFKLEDEILNSNVVIEESVWIRAGFSGFFQSEVSYGEFVEEGQIIAWITDPYGSVEISVISPHSGYIINENQAAIVFQGDAIFHISTKLS